MAKTFRAYEPDQLLLMPPSLREWLPDDHLAYFVSDLVERLELSEILDSYEDKAGYPPYHPVMMTKLLLYGYAVGVRSARELQQATRENVGFRVLCAGNEPDFRTIAAFRARHLEAMEGLFQQVLTICAQAGMAKLGYVAVDGTKIKANASKHKAMSYGPDEKGAQAAAHRDPYVPARMRRPGRSRRCALRRRQRGDELPEELADPAKRLDAIERAMAALEQQATEKAEQKGKEPSKPKDNAQYNFTDPDSRIMKSADRATSRRTTPRQRSTSSTRSSWRPRSPSKPTTKGGWCRWCTRWMTDWSWCPSRSAQTRGTGWSEMWSGSSGTTSRRWWRPRS